MLAFFAQLDGTFRQYYAIATSVELNGAPLVLPQLLYPGAKGGLAVEPNGSAIARIDASGGSGIPGVGAPPRVIYRAPSGGLTDQPNGDPIASISEVNGVLKIECVDS